MNTSISTANFYSTPFNETLQIIKSAGFDYIELAVYWKGGKWEIAQHLKNISVNDVLGMVEDSGLKISTLHDMGGLVENDSDSIISTSTYEYLEKSKKNIPCLVFHTPMKKTTDKNWWDNYKSKTISDMNSIKGNHIICIENLPFFDEYMVPLTDPKEMRVFVDEADIYVNVDTTHYGQCNIDLNHVAKQLKHRIKAIHISDFCDGKPHLYIGDGKLDFYNFSKLLDKKSLHAITIECGLPNGINEKHEIINKYKEARLKIEDIFNK